MRFFVGKIVNDSPSTLKFCWNLYFSRLTVCVFVGVAFLDTCHTINSTSATMVGKTIGGYFSSWKVYSSCKIEDLDPSLCTILYYSFAGLNEDHTIKILDPWGDIQIDGYKKFTGLKSKNPHLKTLLAIGGWNEGSVKYSNMVSTKSSRATFLKSCLDFMKKYNFDGIDLDWEYPSQRGGRPEDKENLSMLLKELREEFDKHGYLLTIAVAAGESNIKVSYDVPALTKYVHYINVMMYDMHSYLDHRTGANAPLYSTDQLNVQSCTKAWLSKGADPHKLILGVGSYGKTYTLANSAEHGIGAPTTGPGLPGPISKAAGTLTYGEILTHEKSGWNRVWSNEQQVPYLYHDNQWVGYDDVDSIKKKVAFAKQYELGGIMMWSIDMDDPHGEHGTKFPLLKTINGNL